MRTIRRWLRKFQKWLLLPSRYRRVQGKLDWNGGRLRGWSYIAWVARTERRLQRLRRGENPFEERK